MGQSQKITLFLAFSVFIVRVGWTQGPENLKQYTSYGELCTGKCDKHESKYFWCTTEGGWDYCSKTAHTDYKYDSCRDDHPCGKYGKSYTWCYNKADTWGYCGLLLNTAEPKMMSYISSKYQSECRDECLYDEERKYFWCNTDKGYDYCSPLPSVTYKNEPCRSDHFCDKHNSRYNWCYTNSGYDYCGVINPGECRYTTTGYNKEKSNLPVLVCTQRGNNLETRFYLEPAQTEIADGSTWRNELSSLIARWDNSHLSEYPTSHVITTENLNIDVQGLVNEYYGVVIKAKVPVFKTSTTVAQVMVSVQNPVPSRHVRRAFAESFRRRAKISLDMSTSGET